MINDNNDKVWLLGPLKPMLIAILLNIGMLKFL